MFAWTRQLEEQVIHGPRIDRAKNRAWHAFRLIHPVLERRRQARRTEDGDVHERVPRISFRNKDQLYAVSTFIIPALYIVDIQRFAQLPDIDQGKRSSQAWSIHSSKGNTM